jgi:hypothetical protein
MRKVVYNCAVSLDGFIEGPNGEFDWCMCGPGLWDEALLWPVSM